MSLSLRVALSGLAVGLVGMVLQGCGGASAPGTGQPVPVAPGVTTPTVTVNATGGTSITTAASVALTITVTGSSSATPAGTVVVTSGNYGSFPATLANGTASVTVPARLLAVGNDTLTATYTPNSSSASSYNSATGTAALTVSSAVTTPTVTATTATYATAGAPFQAVATPSGYVYVGVTGAQTGVQVFAPGTGGLTASCVNPLPSSIASLGPSVADLALLPNGTDLAVGAGNPGAVFLNVGSLTNCTSTGFLVMEGSIASGQGTQDVAVTPDGKYAFISNEYGVAAGATSQGKIGVVQLAYAPNGNATTGTTLLGQISTGGQAIAGMTLSPDGTRLYVTSEIAASATQGAGASNPVLARTGCVQQVGGTPQLNGILTVIDTAKAEAGTLQGSIIATVDAGCSPVRMQETADGSTLWVAVRGDNRVLAFSTGMLEINAGNALLGYASTGGTAPVGIRLFHGQQLLAVANSNRFGAGPTANATVLNVSVPALAGVVQTIGTGLFPREVTVGADDATLYLTNYDSHTLEVISTTVK